AAAGPAAAGLAAVGVGGAELAAVVPVVAAGAVAEPAGVAAGLLAAGAGVDARSAAPMRSRRARTRRWRRSLRGRVACSRTLQPGCPGSRAAGGGLGPRRAVTAPRSGAGPSGQRQRFRPANRDTTGRW